VSDKDEHPAILTEFLPNGSVQDVLDRKNRQFSPTQKMIVLYGIAEALRYLHDDLHVVHRDVKPANVMLTHDNEPVVGDFGLAKGVPDSAARMRQTWIAGSPIYMAPELIRNEEYTTKVDVYAYAVMAWEILSETVAYEKVSNLAQLHHLVLRGGRPTIRSSVPEAFRTLIEKGWDPAPEARPTFGEITHAFVAEQLQLPHGDMVAFRKYVRKVSTALNS
jgi:serine/threonine protein kinase